MIASGTVITPETRDAWLLERAGLVGASEAAAAVGASPWVSPVELWQIKSGRVGPPEGSEAMLWGQLLEPVILAEYERRTGVAVGRRQEFVRHPTLPFLAATLDGVAGDTIVEAKTASAYSRDFGDEEADELPDHYRVQVHAQMACTGLARADLAVLIGGQRLRVYPVERHEPLVGLIEEKVGAFWRCVESDTPPDWGRMGPAELAAVNPGCDGAAEWGAGVAEMVASTVDRIEAEKAEVKAIGEWMETAKSIVLGAMGNARVGALPDGRTVRRYLERVEARTVSYEAKAYTKHYFKVIKGRA